MTNENYIKRFREERGFSLKDAGDLVGMHRQAYHQLETRWPDITMKSLIKVANAFGYDVKINVVETTSNQEQS